MKDIKHIVLIGVGAGGYFIIKKLAETRGAKNFPCLVLFDYDLVEPRNIAYTAYKKKDIGLPKVEVVKNRYGKRISIIPRCERYNNQELPEDSIVISGVDSMAARKDIWFQAGHNQREKVNFFFDGRAGMKTFRVYAINPHNSSEREFYGQTLYPDEEALSEPCSERNRTSFEKSASKIVKEIRYFLRCGKTRFTEFIFDIDLNQIIICDKLD